MTVLAYRGKQGFSVKKKLKRRVFFFANIVVDSY